MASTGVANNPPPLGVLLTPWAKKYGITPSREQFNKLLNPAYPMLQKSLYTPIYPLPPMPTADYVELAEKTEAMQRYRLKGMTSLLMFQNEFISDRKMKMATLMKPIHPLFARTRWGTTLNNQVTYPFVDAGGITRGVWDLEKNDLAWQVMLPSIRLASMILSFLHIHPWLDTLLLGKEEPVDPSRFPIPSLNNPIAATASLPSQYSVVKMRIPGPNNAQECSEAFEELQKWPSLRDLSFGMVVVDKDYLGATHDNNSMVNGYTRWLMSHSLGNRASIWIAYERVSLLMRNDLSDSDRLSLHVLTANVLIHEIMHAIGMAKRHRDQVYAGGPINYPRMLEPYIEDEVCSELGASMENAVWGGGIIPISESNDSIIPSLGYGILRGPQPMLTRHPILLSPPVPKIYVLRPIQVDYYEAIQQDTFWDSSVRNFSHFRPGEIIQNGQTVNFISTKSRTDPKSLWEVVQTLPIYQDAMKPPDRSTQMMDRIITMTTSDRIAFAHAVKQKEMNQAYESLMKLRMDQTDELWNQVELLVRGDMTGGVRDEWGLEIILDAIEGVLGTVNNLLTVLSRFDSSSQVLIYGKEDAMAFNRGLRRLLHEIVEAITLSGSELPALEQKANTISGIVEDTRVFLTISPTLPNGISIDDDISLAQQDENYCGQRLEEARGWLEAGDHSTANKMAEEVSRSMSSTLMTKCAAKILMCHSDRIPYSVRVACLSRAIETLQSIHAPAGRDDEKTRVLDLALVLQTRLLSGDLVEDPSDMIFT